MKQQYIDKQIDMALDYLSEASSINILHETTGNIQKRVMKDRIAVAHAVDCIYKLRSDAPITDDPKKHMAEIDKQIEKEAIEAIVKMKAALDKRELENNNAKLC